MNEPIKYYYQTEKGIEGPMTLEQFQHERLLNAANKIIKWVEKKIAEIKFSNIKMPEGK